MRKTVILVCLALVFFFGGCQKKTSLKVIQAVDTIEVNQDYDPLSIIRESTPGTYQISVVENNINIGELGSYTITFSLKANGKTEKTTYTVKVVDTTSPTIELVKPLQFSTGTDLTSALKIEEFIDVNDNYDQNLYSVVSYSGNYDMTKAGNYNITFSVNDTSGNKASKTFELTVNDSGNVDTSNDSIIGTYVVESEAEEVQSSLILEKDNFFTLKVNYCSGMTVMTGTYTQEDNQITLHLSEFGLLDDQPASKHLTLEIQSTNQLLYTSQFGSCSPKKGQLFIKQ